ncbi:flagellar biosynthesis protein FlhB [Robbsia sp. KACC 23696]|uniref:flagellar biosynthesis protein FlhB n=1 Tax=Robbsia sp. KACC 23696 TaxID=3149231 RepID=UPI00325C0FFD
MAEDSDLEKTESASPRRLEQAREDGQVARSRELSTFALLAVGFGGVYMMSGSLLGQFSQLFRHAFIFDRAASQDPTQMLHRASDALTLAAMAISPILIAITLAALLSPLALGGWLLTTKPLAPNFGRLNPISGLGKMFSTHALAQLGMGIAKCVLVGTVATLVALHYKDDVIGLLTEPVRVALPHAANMVGVVCAATVGAMLLLVAADVPYQLWSHAKKLRMTKEEVKREYKENEGDPHIKGKIREQQRAMARRRMMSQIPTADVIITNPTHFAVALRYADNGMRAPRVVAKGADLVAARIKEIAKENGIPVLEAPPLARSLYKHVQLNREIPAQLYGAVAEVLAWVFQLRRWHAEGGQYPDRPGDVLVPDELAVSAQSLSGSDGDLDDAALDAAAADAAEAKAAAGGGTRGGPAGMADEAVSDVDPSSIRETGAP